MTLNLNWTEKYRPKTLKDIKGNTKAVNNLLRWANTWNKGRPQRQPAAILVGEPGTGKTSAALALAHDKGWAVIELNASDARNYDTINRIVKMGAIHDTFTDTGEFRQVSRGGRKLVILDEADNLHERGIGVKKGSTGPDMSDKGGKKAIIEALSQTKQPILLIVNDLYALTKGRGVAIKKACLIIRFDHLNKNAIKDALMTIAMKEKVKVEDRVMGMIADKSNGDLRSAINDLQTLSVGRRTVTTKDIDALGYRDPRSKIYGALKTIFKTKSLTLARDALRNLDETPEDIILWIDENLPNEYKRTQDLIMAYHYLGRSDIFLRRVYRRQYYGFWSYASELMSGGVSLAKKEMNPEIVRYNFPMYLIKMSRSKAERGFKDKVMRKLRKEFHCDTESARDIVFTLRDLMKRDKRLAARMIDTLRLDEKELAFIVGGKDIADRLLDETEKIDLNEPEDEGFNIEDFEEEPEKVEEDTKPPPSPPEDNGEDVGDSQSSLMDF